MSTWLLIEVDDIADVGINELNRYLINKSPQIDGWVGVPGWDIKCRGSLVHPSTKED